MNAAIVTIGDEILIGQIVDSNSAWIGQQLTNNGIRVREIRSIADEAMTIKNNIEELRHQVDLIVVTGGLGPTKDDITKEVLAEIFRTPMVYSEFAMENLKLFFEKMNRPYNALNLTQAQVPESAVLLKNEVGTASGMVFDEKDVVLVSMPGVPSEMKKMFEFQFLPYLLSHHNTGNIFYKTIITQGLPESDLATTIEKWEEDLRSNGFSLAYLPKPGMVRLRISNYEASKNTKDQYLAYREELKKLIPEHYIGESEVGLAEVLFERAKEKKITIATAESCTSGRLAGEITSVSGASLIFKGGIVAYDNSIKVSLLQVDDVVLQAHGAVSEEVAVQMAIGARKQLQADYAVSTTGIAGPTGGSELKPVGTVWIGVSSDAGTFARKFQFGTGRDRNIQRSIQQAIKILLEEIS